MAINKAETVAFACHVYIAKRTDPNVAVQVVSASTDWKDAGLIEAGTCSVKSSSVIADTQVGDVELGKNAELSINALEVGATNLAELEGLMAGTCDIMFKPVATAETRVLKVLGVSITVNGDFDMSGKKASVMNIKGTSKNIAKWSDFAIWTTLAWSI